MDLNDRFQIKIRYKLDGVPPALIDIDASDFFDAEYASECAPEEWGCDMPWVLLEMEDYVPLSELERKGLEWIRFDIVDTKGPTHRRLVEQRWHGNRLLTDWENLFAEAAPGQLILDLAGTAPESRQILKFSLSPRAVQVVQHAFFSGDELDRPASDFKLPDFPGPFCADK